MAELLKDQDQFKLWVCAIEGCMEKPVIEIREVLDPELTDGKHTYISLSACSDPSHQHEIVVYLKGKAAIGQACLEWENKSRIPDC